MKFLLDTQILIWALDDNLQLEAPIRLILEDNAHELFVSQFSLMEIAIKLKLGKLPGFVITLETFTEQLTNSGLPCCLAPFNTSFTINTFLFSTITATLSTVFSWQLPSPKTFRLFQLMLNSPVTAR